MLGYGYGRGQGQGYDVMGAQHHQQGYSTTCVVYFLFPRSLGVCVCLWADMDTTYSPSGYHGSSVPGTGPGMDAPYHSSPTIGSGIQGESRRRCKRSKVSRGDRPDISWKRRSRRWRTAVGVFFPLEIFGRFWLVRRVFSW